MFRNENIVPKMSFASSWAESRVGRARAGPVRGSVGAWVGGRELGARVVVLDVADEVEVEMGRALERGRSGCRAQRRE